MKIKDVMTKAPCVVDVTDSLERTEQLMAQQEYRHMPVTDKNQLVAILSERDIGIAKLSSKKPASELKVSDVCIGYPYRAYQDEPLQKVLDEMLMLKIGSVLVMDGEELVGIFTTTDACRVLRDQLE